MNYDFFKCVVNISITAIAFMLVYTLMELLVYVFDLTIIFNAFLF